MLIAAVVRYFAAAVFEACCLPGRPYAKKAAMLRRRLSPHDTAACRHEGADCRHHTPAAIFGLMLTP